MLIVAAGLCTAAAASAKLVADYRFNGDFTSTGPAADDAFSIGATFGPDAVAGCTRTVASTTAGESIGVSTREFTSPRVYSVVLQARLASVAGYVRLINWFPSFLQDNGLYLKNGALDFYDNNVTVRDHSGPDITPADTYAEFAISRDAANVLRGYLNGKLQFTYTDAFDMAVTPHQAGNVYFFKDNDGGNGSAGEESDAKVARIRYYNTALPANQITNTEGCFTRKCGGARVTLAGDRRANVIIGTPGRDVIDGLGGKDKIVGKGGNDILCGGPGRDKLIGGKGRDKLIGGKGRDLCAGGAGKDKSRSCEAGRA